MAPMACARSAGSRSARSGWRWSRSPSCAWIVSLARNFSRRSRRKKNATRRRFPPRDPSRRPRRLCHSEAWRDRMKAVVLASGGLDSTVAAAVAKRDGCRLYLLTIAYGQRHRIEVERARQVARALEAADHRVIEVDLRALGGSALTSDQPVPKDRSAAERR